MALSRREQEILAALETQLAPDPEPTDPDDIANGVATGAKPPRSTGAKPPRSTGAKPPRSTGAQPPRSTGRQFVLMLIPQALMVLFGVVWNFGIAGLGVVIGAGVLIWLVVVSHTAPAANRDLAPPRVGREP